jgi:hypothetical protein
MPGNRILTYCCSVLGQDDKRSFKFEEDLPATGADLGNDFPVVRYADILLSKAEALNELTRPKGQNCLRLPGFISAAAKRN